MRVRDLVFGGGFALERSFNMDDGRNGPFGPGWSFNLGDSLTAEADGGIVLRRGTGRVDRFAAVATGVPLTAVTATADTLAQNNDGTYTLRERQGGAVRTFSATGSLLSIRNAGGGGLTLEYNIAGRLSSALYLGRQIRFSFDGPRIASIADGAGRSLSFAYNSEGRLVRQGNADGTSIAYEYDGAGNLTSMISGDSPTAIFYDGEPGYSFVSAVTLPDGSTKQYDVPLSPAQIRVRDGAGDATLYVSSTNGLVQSITDAAGNRTSYAYDASGRRIRSVNAAGESSTFTYDNSGNLSAITDSAGNRWTATYTNDRLTRLNDPNGHPYAFGYDAAGALIAVANAAGDSAATRSAAGQITALTDPRGNKTAFEYDADGLLTTYTDARSSKWTYRYDGAARAISRTDPGGGTLEAEYGPDGRVSALKAGFTAAVLGSPGIRRDALNRITGYTDDIGNRVEYTYDGAGLLSAATLPGGKTVTYQYDRAKRLARVSDWAGNFAIYRYDAAGFPLSATISGGPVTIYQYDSAHRLRAIVSTGPDGKPVAAYRYTLDAVGNRLSVSALDPVVSTDATGENTFLFDAANRPTASSDGRTYRYDSRGNLTSIEGVRAASLSYDAFGRLQVFDTGSSTANGYDSAGLRSARTVNGTMRRFAYEVLGPQPRVVMEANESNSPIAWYVYGLGLLWKVAADGTTYFYHFDADGNVVAVSNPTSGVLNTYRYDSLGRLAKAVEQVENLFRAGGEAGQVDDGNGLLYANRLFQVPELRIGLPAAAAPAPPVPDLLPKLPGAGACFLEGVAACEFATARRERP